MKKLLLVVSLLFLVTILAGCAKLSEDPKVAVSPENYDFGTIDQSKGNVSTRFTVENVGNKPLKILRLSTSCGCTTAEMDMDDLEPGESREMIVTFDPMVHPDQYGPITRVIYLQTSDPKTPEFQIDITGDVVKEISEDEKSTHDDDYRNYEIGPDSAKKRLEEDSNVKILDVRTQAEFEEERIPENLQTSILIPHTEITEASLVNKGFGKDDEIIIVCRSGRRAKIAYDLMKEMGYNNIKVLGGGLVHWREDKLPLDTDIVEEAPQITLDSTFYSFGEIPQKGGVVTTTFKVSNTGTKELVIDTITTSCGCTGATINQSNIAPGENATVTVTFDPDFHEEPSGIFKRTVFIPSNDPDNPEVEFNIEANIIL